MSRSGANDNPMGTPSCLIQRGAALYSYIYIYDISIYTALSVIPMVNINIRRGLFLTVPVPAVIRVSRLMASALDQCYLYIYISV